MQLSERLQRVADFVRGGSRVADIGTDHAFLPIYLTQTGLARHVIACDINEGPLESARSNIALADLAGRIELRLCDGLAAVSPDEVDDIVIAGMGGELIAKIIGDAPWVFDPAKRLVLQPMSSAEDLRRYLCAHGFAVRRENAVEDADKLYAVLCCEYTGEVAEHEPFYYYIGEMARTGGAAEAAYMHLQAQRLRKRADGLRLAAAGAREAEAAQEIAMQIEGEIQNLTKGIG